MTTPQPTSTTETTDQAIGRRVHQLMWDRRLSQMDMQRATGIHQTLLSKKLRGDRRWYANEVAAVAAVLDCPVGALYGDTDGDERSVTHRERAGHEAEVIPFPQRPTARNHTGRKPSVWAAGK